MHMRTLVLIAVADEGGNFKLCLPTQRSMHTYTFWCANTPLCTRAHTHTQFDMQTRHYAHAHTHTYTIWCANTPLCTRAFTNIHNLLCKHAIMHTHTHTHACCAVEDDHGNLKLRLPNRLGIGTVKAASWQVCWFGFGDFASFIMWRPLMIWFVAQAFCEGSVLAGVLI
jgi:hypothetical protein